MPTTAADYRNAALERMGDANELKRLERYPFATYAAGVAVECMLRAFRHQDREHAAHHDVIAHLAASDRDRLGERAWAKLRGPVLSDAKRISKLTTCSQARADRVVTASYRRW